MITDNWNIGNTIANLLVIGLPTWYFGNRWVKAREAIEAKLEKKQDDYEVRRLLVEEKLRKDFVESTAKIASDLEIRHTASMNDIKNNIVANRKLYVRTYKNLKDDMKELSNYQKVANGRVGKVEIGLAKIQQAHEDRVGKHERSNVNVRIDC